MELEKTVDSFIQDFLQTESYVDKELMNYRDHGWVCDIKNFHAIFEEMAKAIYHLDQNGENAIQTLEDELMKLTSEHETRTLSANELEKEIEEMQKVCESLKSEIKKQDEQKADLEKKAKNNYLGLEHEVSIIGKQNKTLYLITRLTWDDKAMKKDLNLIKGFVFNKTNNDVSVFETDPKKTNNKTIVSDLLWDYIGAGISQEWKKGKDWKM